MEPIYLDHAATTPVHRDVVAAMYPMYENLYGNPSSIHSFGRKARQLIDEARHVMAKSIQADEKEIIFTSSGTEADNMAFIGTALANKEKGNHIITSVQEHHAVLHAAEYLEENGFNVTYLPVDHTGRISLEALQAALTDDTILVSIMFANNETGVIQPIKEIGNILNSHQAIFHTDAVQAYGLLPIDVTSLGIDLLSVSAHKINGPKGIGFLYVNKRVHVQPLAFGGEQERKRRPGTENVVSMIGFQKAVEIMLDQREKRNQTYAHYKELFINRLRALEVPFKINGAESQTLNSIVNISFPGTNVEALLTNFDLNGIAASSGSACTAGSVEPSHVLAAMFGQDEACTNSVRFSFGLNNTEENIVDAANRVAKIVNRIVK
ncbi:cysteine desulfurase family protein [Virgibacillus soli]|uniref:cysteine desulfurase family protein n=1 Tax=Paracerasibacillus soli TaxID=480284 RepID=UPI0035ED518E